MITLYSNNLKMKKILFLMMAAAMMVASCNKPAPEPEPGPGPDPVPEETEPVPVVVTEPYLVTSEIIMQFIENVTYDERDYSYTHVTDPEYASYGAPGEADMPP